MKPRWVIGVLIALAGAGALTYRYGVAKKAPQPRFETARVERGRVVAKVTATGTLSALVTVQVGSQVSGRIKEIFVDFNSPVKKKQVLARIDPQLFDASLEQSRANFLAAQADLAAAKVRALEAERQLTRTRSLAEGKLISPAELDTAQANEGAAHAQVDAALGRVAQNRAGLHQAEVNLAYTTITSPIDGIVVSRSVDVGQTVAASLQAPILFVLAEDLRRMQVDTSVAEADIGKLTPGMAAQFMVDAFPGERFSAKVRQIRNAAQTVQNVVTYDAVVDVDNTDLRLRPGMTANVTFVHAERSDVLRVPNAALRYRPASAEKPARRPPVRTGKDQSPGMRTVWVSRDGKEEPVQIKPGVTDGTLTEVLEGALHEGDLVITDGASTGDSARPSGGPNSLRRMF